MPKIGVSEITAIPYDGPEMLLQEMIGRAAAIKSNRLSVAKFIMEPNTSVPSHFHRASEEVYFVLDGSALMTVDDKSYPITTGDVIMVERGERHQVVTREGERLEFLAITVPAYSDSDFIIEA